VGLQKSNAETASISTLVMRNFKGDVATSYKPGRLFALRCSIYTTQVLMAYDPFSLGHQKFVRQASDSEPEPKPL
jgi:hypothetical protein